MAGKLSALRAIDPSRYVVYVGFLIILVAFSIVLRDDGFLTTRNLLNIVQQTAPVTVMAVGAVFVLAAGAFVGVPSLVLWTVFVIGIGHFFYAESRFGAHVHAIGDNAGGSRAVGIRVERIRFAVMALSGVMAALAGLLYAGRLHGAR